MPGGKREYCKTHKKEGMVNVNIKLCIDPECPHHALYGNEDGTKEYCKTHKKEGMVDRVHKKCKTCNKHLALYGPVGEKATYCYEHSADDMVDLIHKKCKKCHIKRPFFNLSKKSPDYCYDCKTDEMVNVSSNKCEECNAFPNFNFEGMKAKYCDTHKELGMIRVTGINQCTECVVSKWASFGFSGEKAIVCATHKKEGMVDLVSNLCQFPECPKNASFGIEKRKPIMCKLHKTNKMTDVKHKKCYYEDCPTIPSFGYEDDYIVISCKKHSDDEMISINAKQCLFNGCDTAPSYGFPDGKPTHCSEHKTEQMVDVVSKKCEICNKTLASFGYAGEPAIRCKKHMEYDMVDVKAILCTCGIRATFGYEGEKPEKCKTHKEPDMIDVRKKNCDNCSKRAGFGIPGHPPTKCARHKTKGMIRNPRKRCITKPCDQTALYGISNQIHCEKHKEDGEYNLVEKDCKSCNLPMIINDKGLCHFCDPTMIKKFHLAKQKEIKTLLDNKKYKYTLYDQIVDSQCNLFRPDFVFDCAGYCVVLECDEDQHSVYKCEKNRMINISQALGIKTIFIRYNPDKFKSDKVTKELTKMQRQIKLLKVLDGILKQDHEKLEFLSVVYLFYDNYDPINITLETIDIFDN